ncbi:MAG: glycosyltransferase family 4 protein [Anaerolineae bacterium]
MKVCFISGEFPPMQGGIGDYTRELARALTKFGVEAHVVTSVKAGLSGLCIVHPIIETWSWRSLRTIDALLDDLQPAIIHIQYQTAAYSMHPAINFLPLWLRWRRANLRAAITYHDLRVPYLFPKAGPVRWWVTLAPARWSYAVIVTNAEDWQRLETGDWRLEITTSPRSPISNLQSPTSNLQSPFLIPIGSNIHPNPPADFDPDAWRAQVGIGRDETMLVYFGFLNASKGGETLIQGLDQLTQRGYNCRLVMLGGQVGASDPTNRAYLARVNALIDKLDLADRVMWTGFLPDERVSTYLMAADLAVLPYRDGASLRRGSLMAALAHGVPVVTTHPQEIRSTCDLPQLIDGVNIRLVPPDDPDALAQTVGDLIDDPTQRRQLGLAARRLSQAFTWERIAAQHKAVYDQIATTSAPE